MADFLTVAAPILARVPGAMGDLVGPVKNRGIQGDMPALLEIVDKSVAAATMRECLHASLWVLADDLEQAHRICQEIETPHGAAWHAVVHRREGDFWNSKYWWGRAAGVRFSGLSGRIKSAMRECPQELASWLRGDSYDAAGFVDLVERYSRDLALCQSMVAMQRMEWLALFEECWSG